MNKYWPIGSVVMLIGGTRRVMILGYGRYLANDPDHVYDYVGCAYPDGYVGAENAVLFNNDQIASIVYLGLQNVEATQFGEHVAEVIAEVRSKES